MTALAPDALLTPDEWATYRHRAANDLWQRMEDFALRVEPVLVNGVAMGVVTAHPVAFGDPRCPFPKPDPTEV